jgi:hypothetical protein
MRGARFVDLLAAEWIKIWSLRSTRWVLLGSAAGIVGCNADAAYADFTNWPHYDAATRAAFVPGWAIWDAFTSTAGMVMILAIGSIGALAIAGEHGTGQIRTTFAAVPARGSVMVAKIIVLAAISTGYGAVVAGSSFWATQAILSGRGAGLSIGDPGVPRVLAASALLAPLSALIGLGFGTLIRHGAASVVAVTLVVLVLPAALSDNRHWSAVLAHAMPRTAWGRLVEIEAGGGPFAGHAYPWTTGGAWTVYAAWAAASIAVAVAGVQRRDL